MRVYRIEDVQSGEGVFNCGAVRRAMRAVAKARGKRDEWELFDRFPGGRSEPDPYRHPGPDRDVPGWADRPDCTDFYCGFRDVSQLARWFDSEAVRVELNNQGVELVEFEVDPEHVLTGHFQVMFKRGEATRIGSSPIPTLQPAA